LNRNVGKTFTVRNVNYSNAMNAVLTD